ncbi:hypothetical protein C2W62_39250 [Candidatus Entotheonella serta]|nr:hypothetical protein C2W62_39250 [Candidatus Entotheonella serta]
MQALAQWVMDSEMIQLAYIAVLLGTLVLPMLFLAIWYHSNIKRTEGGKRLMEAQNSLDYRPSHSILWGGFYPARMTRRNVENAARLHSNTMSGKYGTSTKALQVRVYKICGWWLLALSVLGAAPFVVARLAGT